MNSRGEKGLYRSILRSIWSRRTDQMTLCLRGTQNQRITNKNTHCAHWLITAKLEGIGSARTGVTPGQPVPINTHMYTCTVCFMTAGQCCAWPACLLMVFSCQMPSTHTLTDANTLFLPFLSAGHLVPGSLSMFSCLHAVSECCYGIK